MSDGIYANVQPGLPADVASCCHYRNQVLRCSTRSVREVCLCTQVETLYGEVQRISDSSGPARFFITFIPLPIKCELVLLCPCAIGIFFKADDALECVIRVFENG